MPNNFGVFTENVPLNGSGPVRGLLLQRRKDSDPNRKRLGGGISTFPNLRREEWQSLAKKTVSFVDRGAAEEEEVTHILRHSL